MFVSPQKAACPTPAPAVAPPLFRAPPARRRRTAWPWLSLLCVGAALVPLAAMDGDPADPSVAAAAQRGRPAVAAATAVRPTIPVARELAEEPSGTPAIRWRDSTALGTPNAGRLVAGVLLPARGDGFYTYDPATQRTPGGVERQWGSDTLVREIVSVGRWWAATHPNQPRLGIGDLSRPGGGPFTGPGIGHASHQNGRDVDIRLPRRDGVEGPANPGNYDRALTQQLTDRLVAQGAELVLVGPGLDIRGPAGVVVTWPNHDDHLHVRFPA